MPESLLDRVARAAATAAPATSSSSSSWGPLEAAVHESVFAWLPAGARRVRLAWDARRREVVARFEVAAEGARER